MRLSLREQEQHEVGHQWEIRKDIIDQKDLLD